jgi:hypothetical protein
MNKRIQALADQAGKYADETQPRGSFTRDGMWLYAYNGKFAELIVLECVETLGTYEDYWTREQSMTELKKHFGVKS